MESIISFGRWVQQRRRALRLTQDELARLVGCSLVLIRKIEADARRPSAQIAGLLARHLQLPHDQHATFIRVARAELAIFRLPTPDMADHPRVTRLPEILPHHLPTPPDTLLGRDAAIAAVRELIEHEHARLVMLIGPPGIGKTRLGLAAAYMLLPAFPDGAWFVDLAPISDPALALPAIVRLLALPEQPNQAAIDILVGFLGRKRTLLLLDNLEQILAIAPQIAELLASVPGLTVLATSRAALRVRGEYLYAVPPLAPATAVDLFARRTRAVRPDFALMESNMVLVDRIVARLDGLPLAIELAAARMRLFSLEQLLAGLETRLPLLMGGPRDAPARQQTLRDAVAWSYELLSAEEQAFFRRLGVFVGGWTAEAAEAVAMVKQEPSNAAAVGAVRDRPASIAHRPAPASLETLLDQSLITREGERFGMLETLREYALERLAAEGEEPQTRHLHALYMLALAEQAELAEHTLEERGQFDRLEYERGNLNAALEWSCREHVDPNIGLRLARAQAAFWQRRGSQREGRAWMKRISARQGGDPRLRVRFLGRVFWLNDLDGEVDWAEQCATEGLEIYRALADPQGIALMTGCRGMLLEDCGRYAEALTWYREAEILYRATGSIRDRAMVTFWIGNTLFLMGRFVEARDALQESLAHGRTLASPMIIARRLALLGLIQVESGEMAAAEASLAEGLKVAREIDNRLDLAIILTGYSRLLFVNGRHNDALRLLGAADRTHQLIGMLPTTSDTLVYQRMEAKLRASLAPDDFTAAWESGRALTIDQAVELALTILEHRPYS